MDRQEMVMAASGHGALFVEKLRSVLGGANILFIVPPFATTSTPILGPLILQQLALAKGFSVDILHLNLLLASEIGLECYESICFGQPFRQMGERLFARSAHGLPALGRNTQWCLDASASVFGDRHEQQIDAFEYKYVHVSEFDLDRYFEIENSCFHLIEASVSVIAENNYTMVGCSGNWEQNNCCIALLKGIKEKRSQTVTLMGGCNCEDRMAEGIASLSTAIDYIFSGEAETTFIRFLHGFRRGELPQQRIISGEPEASLEESPPPGLESYIAQRRQFLGEADSGKWVIGYETSRGCWWGKCNFCGLNGSHRVRFREKPVNKSLRELDVLHNQYPKRPVGMVDKVMPKSYGSAFLQELGQRKNTPAMSYEVRPDLSFKELLDLRVAGFAAVKPGIEALSTDLLALMNKGVTAVENILLLRHARALKMYVDWNLLWGFPGDKAEHYKQTLEVLPHLRHLCPPAVFRHISIDRFSPYFQRPAEFGIRNQRPWAVYGSVYPEGVDLHNLAYRFIGDYASDAREHPDLIRQIADEVEIWKKAWRQTQLEMQDMIGFYVICDTRCISDEAGAKPRTLTVDREHAAVVMTRAPVSGCEFQQWAIENNLGIVVDSTYVPLVTAAPGLLLKFEESVSC